MNKKLAALEKEKHRLLQLEENEYNNIRLENVSLQIENMILRDRLHQCKQTNREQKQKLKNTINFMIGDEENYHGVQSVSDMVWELDTISAGIISKLLKKFKKNKDSIPSQIYDKYKDEEKATEEWNKILDKIIYAFDLAAHNSEIKTEKEEKEKKRGMLLFVEYFDSLWI